MQQLVDACNIEISWFMITATDEEKALAGVTEDFYFTDVYVVDQECSGVKSDMDDDAVNKLCNELLNMGIDPSRCKGWGHSHVNMAVAHSGTDEATVERLQLEPLISIIMNKKGDVNLRCDQWEPWRSSWTCNYVIDQIQLIPDSWGKDMVDKHVRIEKPTVMKWAGNKSKSKYNSSYYGWHGGWDDFKDTSSKDPKHYTAKEMPPPDEDEGWIDDVEFLKGLQLPDELAMLQECFESRDIDINELVTLYAEWHAKEISTSELEDNLLSIYGVPREDEDEVDPAFHYDENPKQEDMVGYTVVEA